MLPEPFATRSAFTSRGVLQAVALSRVLEFCGASWAERRAWTGNVSRTRRSSCGTAILARTPRCDGEMMTL